MTREQLIENFADSVEQERIALGYSQAQMAQALDMSLSTYKRIINGEISKLDFFIFYQLYQLTGKFAFELCKYGDPLSDTVASMRRLSQPQLRTIRGFVDFEDHFARSLNDKQESSDYTTLIIPSGCMHDGMIYDSCSLDKINIASSTPSFAIGERQKRKLLCHSGPVSLSESSFFIVCLPLKDTITAHTMTTDLTGFRISNSCIEICHYKIIQFLL